MTRPLTALAPTFGVVLMLALPGCLAGQDAAAMASGAQVWANNCVRCHNARPSSERSDAEWTVIVNHMRARANLTRTQARHVTAFLQATNGIPVPVIDLAATPARDGGEEAEGTVSARAVAAAVASQLPDGLPPEMVQRLLEYVRRLGATSQDRTPSSSN